MTDPLISMRKYLSLFHAFYPFISPCGDGIKYLVRRVTDNGLGSVSLQTQTFPLVSCSKGWAGSRQLFDSHSKTFSIKPISNKVLIFISLTHVSPSISPGLRWLEEGVSN